MAVIELQGLSVKLGRLQVLKNLNASLGGGCIGLLGPNGSGKTTLVNTLLGFYPPNAGTAQVLGRDILSEAKEIRTYIGYMPESDSFIANMTGIRFVRMMGEISGLRPAESMERAHEALFYVGLGEARYRPVGTYSMGMKQLVKLAQALVHGPRLLILDEPTNGLDPPARLRMLKLVKEIRDGGQVHVILSSHLLRDVELCCDEVLILRQGEVAVYTNLEEERKANRKFIEMETLGAPDAFIGAIEKMGCEVALHKGRIKTVLPPHLEIRSLYEAAAETESRIRRLDFKRDSLHDIFMKAMEGERNGSL